LFRLFKNIPVRDVIINTHPVKIMLVTNNRGTHRYWAREQASVRGFKGFDETLIGFTNSPRERITCNGESSSFKREVIFPLGYLEKCRCWETIAKHGALDMSQLRDKA
jgi:hypothetical protein